MELKGLKIDFLGDSITQGTCTSGPDAIYHGVLKKEAVLGEVRNYGIGGTRIARQIRNGVVGRIFTDNVDFGSFCERFDKMDDDADVVVVFGGTNDYGHGDAPIGTFNDRTPDTFYGACHYLFEGLIKKYIGKPIVVMTPLHRVNENALKGEDDKTKNIDVLALKDYVGIIKEVAEYYALPVLDLYATSTLQPEIKEIREKYCPDGLHPNDEGHKIIAAKLKRFLENL